MFNALESTWDHSGRRRWTTLASFTMQALGLSLLLAIPLLWVQGPPQLRWFDPHILVPPSAPAAPAPPAAQQAVHSSNVNGEHLLPPTAIPTSILHVDDLGVPPAPDLGNVGVNDGIGHSRPGVANSLGDNTALAPTPPPAPTHPIRLSHWAEGNLIYRVQPNYPVLAREARIQGTVELRAIVSKSGAIEHLSVVNGHAMLVTAAIEAVKQWRYRPYLLNGEPVEVETDITVNFVLSGH